MFYPPAGAIATRPARPNCLETARTSAPNFPPGGRKPRRNNDWALPFVVAGSGDALQHTQTLQPSSEPAFPDTYPIQTCGVSAANYLGYGDETSTNSAAQNVATNGSNGSAENAGLNQMQMLVERFEMQNEATQARILELEKTVRSICALLIKMDLSWEKGFGSEGAIDGRIA